MSAHAVLPPHVKRFSPAGSRQLEIDGETSSHLLQFFYSFHKTNTECQQLFYTGEKLSCLTSIESLNFLTPFKICFTYDGLYNCVKSNRKKHTRGLKLILIKEVPRIFIWRPQRAIRRIGASDPPLYSCKNLSAVLKVMRPNRQFFLF